MGYWKDEGLDGAQRYLVFKGNPFTVIDWQSETFKDKDSGREWARLICSCPKVTTDGKCSIYETRPLTCRRYAPGSDQLCVFSSMSGIQFHPREGAR